MNRKSTYPVKEPKILEMSAVFMKMRVVFYSACLLHLLVLVGYILPKDLTVSKDSRIVRMYYMKHVLLTAWDHYLLGFYFIISAYVDWKYLRGEQNLGKVQTISKLRHDFFTSIVLPVTLYADFMFWGFWMLDRELLVPSGFDEFVAVWLQHNLHSWPLVVVMLDLLLVPRSKPTDIGAQTRTLNIFSASYLGTIFLVHDVTGHWPYPFLGDLSPLRLILFGVCSCLGTLLFFHAQLFVIAMRWQRKTWDLKTVKDIAWKLS